MNGEPDNSTLAEGENTITAIATGGARLNKTVTVTVYYESLRDGILTPTDAAIALQLAATGAHDPAADVSGDGRVTSLDALMILQAAAGSIEL